MAGKSAIVTAKVGKIRQPAAPKLWTRQPTAGTLDPSVALTKDRQMNDCRKNSSHHAPRDEAWKRDRFPEANVYGMRWIKRLLFAPLLLAVAVSGASGTELGIQQSRFTVDGRPTFLHGISYYGALGANREPILEDLDDMQKYGFNWIRVWATWSAFDNDVSAVDAEGRLREPFMDKLQWLVAECDRRGMIVDVTLTKGEGRLGHSHVSALDAHLRALETLTSRLKAKGNWYVDLANEHNIRSKYVSFEDASSLRDRVKQVDDKRLVTISYVGDIPKEDVAHYLLDVKVDFLSPHRPRNARSAGQTEHTTRQYLTAMRELGRVIPVHYQEPFRRDFSKGWQPKAADFAADLLGAIEGGAAGWCFHNGDNRWAPDAQPRRSFDMRENRLFTQLDEVERQAIRELAKQVQ